MATSMTMSSHAPTTDTQQIWADFSGRLHAFIARRVDSTADADDILQEVFVRIHRHADTVERQERLTSWLYQVTRNAIIDYYRAPVRRRELLSGAPQDLEFEVREAIARLEDHDAGAGDAARELANCLRPMVAQLSPNYRDAVIMIDLEGVPQKDAALRAGVSLSGMKSRVQRGRQALEQLMHACCQIETDTGGRIMDYQVREAGCGTCAGGCG
jgi:RNA polymerase sigma-70 factor (ECF subfamily)